MLIKDPRLRPSISSVIKRFEHVHALLVVTGPTHFKFASSKPHMTEALMIKSLSESVHLLKLGHDKRINLKNIENLNENIPQISVNSIMTINENISYCSKHYLKSERNLAHLSITHIVSMTSRDELCHLNQAFDILCLKEFYQINSLDQLTQEINYPMILSLIVDFIKKATIRKGKVLFVEEDELLDTTSPKSLVGEYIILALSKLKNIPAYEVYTEIRTTNPIFDIAHGNLKILSTWCMKQIQVQNYIKSFPKLECLCGACCIILKRQFANTNNMYSTNCNCIGNRSFEGSNCPSPGCFDFMMYMRKINSKVKYDRLKWGYVGHEDFILGPHGSGITHSSKYNVAQRQILSTSMTIDENTEMLESTSTKNTERETQWVTYK